MKKISQKLLFVILMGAMTFSCSQPEPSVFSPVADKINAADFTKTVDGKPVSLYTLKGANGIGMKVTNYGGRIVALCVPDANNRPVDVVMGYNSIDEYLNNTENFFGAAIGRYGNRIGDAKFMLNDQEVVLTKNEGENQLHGGPKGFFAVVWDAEQVTDSKVVFTCLSPDGDQGFPGNMKVKMSYELTTDNVVKIDYEATTDKATVCNLTHHSYFNLSGETAKTINDHILMIKANAITPVDSVLIPTGEIAEVAGTPFDFTAPTAIGERVNEVDDQLKLGGGYDHNWVLAKDKEGEELICSIYSPLTKIKMDIITDQPGIQFYGGNFIDGTLKGKSGTMYPFRSGFCLETQHFPDSPNQSSFPSVNLNPGETYEHTCSYKFSVVD